jgi:energy-coupling factor transporter ATP-binding protein EcfA2
MLDDRGNLSIDFLAGITIFMIEHVMKAVMGTCEKIMVIHYGVKLAEGKPEEVELGYETFRWKKGYAGLSKTCFVRDGRLDHLLIVRRFHKKCDGLVLEAYAILRKACT